MKFQATEGIYELDGQQPLKIRLTQSKNVQKNTVITMGSATMRRTQSDPDRQDGYDFDLDEEEFSGRTIQVCLVPFSFNPVFYIDNFHKNVIKSLISG